MTTASSPLPRQPRPARATRRRASDSRKARGSPGTPAAAAAWPEAGLLAAILGDLHGEIRRQFPSLERDLAGGPRVYLNSGGGTLVAEPSVQAMAHAAQYANAQDGELTAGERLTAALQQRARADAADFLNAPFAAEIAFHLSTTHALFNLAVALRDQLKGGDNIVITELDHAANVSPWESLWGEDRGLEIRTCRMRSDGTLDLADLARCVDERTRVVAVTHASNALGTVVPIAEAARIAHRHGRPAPPRKAGGEWRGALLVVDAVHHAYHAPIDVQELRCDFLAFSGYKLFGPMVGALWGRREWLEALRPYRVEPNADEVPTKFEQGTPNNAVLAGLSGALGYLRRLGERVEHEAASRPASGFDALRRRLARYAEGPRRHLKLALWAIREHERLLSRSALEGFRRLARRGVHLHGIDDPLRIDERDPTFLFEVEGQDPERVRRELWNGARIEIPRGGNFALVVYRVLRSRRTLRVSFAHYDSIETVERFLKALEKALA